MIADRIGGNDAVQTFGEHVFPRCSRKVGHARQIPSRDRAVNVPDGFQDGLGGVVESRHPNSTCDWPRTMNRESIVQFPDDRAVSPSLNGFAKERLSRLSQMPAVRNINQLQQLHRCQPEASSFCPRKKPVRNNRCGEWRFCETGICFHSSFQERFCPYDIGLTRTRLVHFVAGPSEYRNSRCQFRVLRKWHLTIADRISSVAVASTVV